MHRVMKALAEQRLQDQVSKMELKLGEFKHLKQPVFCLDSELYITHLGKVRSCLMSQSCTILVSMHSIQTLDKLKKGGDPRNVNAREAIRYLEQRFQYPTPYLVGQRPEDVKSVSVNASRGYQSVLECCLFFMEDLKNTDCAFSLVTDHQELIDLAARFEIPCINSVSWASRF